MASPVMWVKWALMKQLFTDLEEIGGQAAELETYAKNEVFDGTPFEYSIAGTGLCVLKPIADALDECGEAFGTLRTTFDTKWEGLTAALAVSCRNFENQDDAVQHQFLHDLLTELGL